MELIIIAVFVIGYLGIALEHTININKTAIAILTGVICWTLFVLSSPTPALLSSESFQSFIKILDLEKNVDVASLSSADTFHHFVTFQLAEHLSSISQILFFLMGAMTIVELVDSHHGFKFITDRIKTKKASTLLWIICLLTFFMSAILDNLTTSIVMISLIRKLIHDKEMKLTFAGMIVIAANAGGAWTPIGDVTTTMLWIGGQISTVNIMKVLFLPSLVCMIVPLLFLSFKLKGTLEAPAANKQIETVKGSMLMFIMGVGALISVPIFKTITHLPPYIGMLLGLGVLWVTSELIHPDLDEAEKKHYTAAGALSRIDVSSVLFFLGILLAVGALESMQLLNEFAVLLDHTFGDQRIIVTLIGVLSSIVDNVPLVAASIGMYDLHTYPMDNMIWEYLAYCAGTGGSILIIGSAAGVAVMGMEKIDFMWYLKRMSLLALMGYAGGAAVYIILQTVL